METGFKARRPRPAHPAAASLLDAACPVRRRRPLRCPAPGGAGRPSGPWRAGERAARDRTSCSQIFTAWAVDSSMDAASNLRRIPDLPDADADTAGSDEFKAQVRSHYDRLAGFRDRWYGRNRFYHGYIEGALQRIVPAGSAVLELGSSTGNLLDSLQPARGVGVDLSPAVVEIAQRKYPDLTFLVGDAETVELGEPFEFIVASDLVGELLDITAMLECVHELSQAETRLLITFHNPALEAVLRVPQGAGLTMPPAPRHEVGKNEAADPRTPGMGARPELLFVDGASTDGTRARIEELRRRFAGQRD